MQIIKYAATAVLVAGTLSACATKGFVRRGLDDQRTELQTSINAERDARSAGDNALQTDINGVKVDLAALRSDLAALKTDFGARISAAEGMVTFVMPVHFQFDDAGVRDNDRAALERFATVAQAHYRGASITIEGFADPAGSAQYNLRLSRERAESVKNYLVSKGLDGSLLKTVGYGESRLVRPNAAGYQAGAELNRRVTFVVEAPAEATVAVLSMR